MPSTGSVDKVIIKWKNPEFETKKQEETKQELLVNQDWASVTEALAVGYYMVLDTHVHASDNATFIRGSGRGLASWRQR